MFDELAEKNNVIMLVTSSYRSADKKLSKQIVKPAKTSNHLAGHAIDFNVKYGWKLYESADLVPGNIENLPQPVQHFIRGIWDNDHLRWGGDFNAPDPVHVDIALNRVDLKRWKRYYNGRLQDFTSAKSKWRLWF